MSEALYERYKDALRRGHVAALRGRLNAALLAYTEAAEIAPERSLPHASLGSVLRRLERHDEALAAYGMALDLAPRDETAMAGRAETLAAIGRRVDAADQLDELADIQESDGRAAEACDTARRALELAESRTRRRHVERLARLLRESPADDAAAAALGRALGILEPPTVADATPPSADADAALAAADAEPAAPEPEPPPPDPTALTMEAEAFLDAGDNLAARDRLLAAAKGHRAAGHVNAALDACYLALGIAPFDPELHLTLAELYLDRGWQSSAADKLLLLGRLVDLDEDAEAHRRLCRLVAERLPDEARLAAICA